VRLQERAVRRILVDVAFLDVNLVLRQKTSGVPAGRSGGLPEEQRLHPNILTAIRDPRSAIRDPRSAIRGGGFRLGPLRLRPAQ
jgi:hypothetical protein